MSSLMQPTVGRKVWYWCGNTASVKDDLQPFDATIVFVHGPDLVDLSYTNHYGTTSSLTSVRLLPPSVPAEGLTAPGLHGVLDNHSNGAPHATWMPFQVGQAKAATQHPAVAAASPIAAS